MSNVNKQRKQATRNQRRTKQNSKEDKVRRKEASTPPSLWMRHGASQAAECGARPACPPLHKEHGPDGHMRGGMRLDPGRSPWKWKPRPDQCSVPVLGRPRADIAASTSPPTTPPPVGSIRHRSIQQERNNRRQAAVRVAMTTATTLHVAVPFRASAPLLPLPLQLRPCPYLAANDPQSTMTPDLDRHKLRNKRVTNQQK